MDLRDLRIETQSNSSPSVLMRVTYVPTGEQVEGEGMSRFRLKRKLIAELEHKLGN
jgi:hypothetical protein